METIVLFLAGAVALVLAYLIVRRLLRRRRNQPSSPTQRPVDVPPRHPLDGARYDKP